ncbi:Na+/H+ antiporter NhaC [Crocinitomicaceae bacterium]|nr:Na+/H+ antiporter NhaC [Crocinitomicaceae bacterium]
MTKDAKKKLDTTQMFLLALIPVLILIGLLGLSVYLYEDDSLSGANQMALIIGAVIAGLVGWRLGFTWKDIEKGMVRSIKSALPAILILLMIGALSGAWLISGIVPTMIYYGLEILNPTIFLFAACVISAIVAVATGSSWSTVATVGVALIGIGSALGIDSAMSAGAIISGAYFGDKMSPLSDTTNLAPAMAGTDLFTHIRYMALTTVPSIAITLILFLIIGFSISTNDSEMGALGMSNLIKENFVISPWFLLVPALVVFLIVKKVAALPALFIGTIAGCLVAVFFQPDVVQNLGANHIKMDGESVKWAPNYVQSSYMASIDAMTGGVNIDTGNAAVTKLLTSKGMFGMLNTIWLIVCAMCFGGIMEACGLLQAITKVLMRMVRSTGSLIATTTGTCLFFNTTASDQYLSIVVPGRMYAEAYKDRGLAPENLSRTLEDSGTVTSVLVPWNTCGATQSGVLGVATGEYFIYCFFNLISPIMTVVFGYVGIKIAKLNPKKKD